MVGSELYMVVSSGLYIVVSTILYIVVGFARLIWNFHFLPQPQRYIDSLSKEE